MAKFLDASEFTAKEPKALPVILLLDTSDSMNIITDPSAITHDTGQIEIRDGHRVRIVEGGTTRIAVLNKCVKDMLAAFANFEKEGTELLISIITFGKDTRLFVTPTTAAEVRCPDLEADNETPLGKGLEIAKDLIENSGRIPSGSYRPLVVLVSDGRPNDDWEGRLADFIQNGRSSKCDRMALAISKEADRKMLARFIEGTTHTVQEADTAEQITTFFNFVTSSTLTRTTSKNPNEIPPDASIQLMMKHSSKTDEDDDGETIY
ncbi:MAG: VWA domain-containing protein [Thermoguttaceae bacterium]|nr:VWA domain-containing protein [Thermoguttaceae bacterium]